MSSKTATTLAFFSFFRFIVFKELFHFLRFSSKLFQNFSPIACCHLNFLQFLIRMIENFLFAVIWFLLKTNELKSLIFVSFLNKFRLEIFLHEFNYFFF